MENEMAAKMKEKTTAFGKLIKTVSIAIGGFIGIIILFNSITFSVQYGTIGVVTRFGEIIGDPAKPGLHFKLPIVDKVVTYRTQKIIYETSRQPSVTGAEYNSSAEYQSSLTTNYSNADYQDVAVDTTTKDGQQIAITYSVRFSINPDKIKNIATRLGTEEEVVDKIVKTDSRIRARNIPRGFSAIDLYTGNIDQVSQKIEDELKPLFEENGLILDEFGIRAIIFDQEYVDAIEQKQIEKEKVTTEEFIAQQEEFKKAAQITKAEGEAEAQRLQQQTLTEELIKKLYIEKWNGVLPEVMTGNESSLLIDINND